MATQWEYLLVALPVFEPPQDNPGGSTAVSLLRDQGLEGWEGIGLTTLEHGECAVLMKREVVHEGRVGGSRI